MKKVAAIAVGSGLFLGLAVVVGVWWLWAGPGPAPGEVSESGPVAGKVMVRIPTGMTLAAAADTLEAKGLLKRPWVLRVGARLTGRAHALRAGLFELPVGASPRDILRALTSGAAVLVKVTLPEGLVSEQVAEIMGSELGFHPEVFLAAADSLVLAAAKKGSLLRDPALEVASHDSLLAAESDKHPRRFRWCEGHLAPDTFFFAEGTGPVQAAQFLVATQKARLDSVMAGADFLADPSLTGQELLTLASIVEAEARHDDERPLIAAVYVNRLRKGWRLEADPTVAFILQKKGKRLFYRDLEVESPYNTYRNKGLPPAPICNPGLQALVAAGRPDPACRAMYFVSDGQGGHVFSRTAEEHEAAVRAFRRARAAGQNGRED